MIDVCACDHVGIVVPSLNDALDFWLNGLGASLERRFEAEGPALSAITGAPPNSHVCVAMIECAGQKIELLEYAGTGTENLEGGLPYAPGVLHLALNVRDVASALQAIERYGYWPVGNPSESTSGSIYVRGPGGVSLEFRRP